MPRHANGIDIERAKVSPADEFGHPDEVVSAESLSDEDKRSILDQWETDAKALARAGDEGMADGEPSLLRDVQQARRKLRRSAGIAPQISQD